MFRVGGLYITECVKSNIWQEHPKYVNKKVGITDNDSPIDSSFRPILVDESYEHVSPKKKLWYALANISDHPQFMFLSGTPFEQTGFTYLSGDSCRGAVSEGRLCLKQE